MILTIVLGLLGLGIVVLVHELGHFLAARAVGVEVEAFSIGWGPKLVGFKRGSTEWRISVFPIGGYCKMKGEDAFRKALESKTEELPREKGSFYGATPLRRIIIALSGPAANVLFAILVFIVVSAIGYSVPTSSNRIALASEYSLDGLKDLRSYPADKAGLKTGDRIVKANGKNVADYMDIQEIIALSADRPLKLEVERAGSIVPMTVVPALDKETGAGRIGVYSWIDPVVEEVKQGSVAALAGVSPGDRLVAVNGVRVKHAIEMLALLSSHPEQVSFTFNRGGSEVDAPMVMSWSDSGESNLGLVFATQVKTYRANSAADAVGAGLTETWKTASISLKGLGMLFKGVDLLKAVSGPARITYLVGRSASEGLQKSGVGGMAIPFNFLAFLSIGLFIMNLLPIPALDGGLIVMFIIEMLRNRPLRTKTVYRFQFVGAAFIMAIFIFATVGDVLFFAAK